MWLVVIYPFLNSFSRNHLPPGGASVDGGDFSQYYSGALSVRIWKPETLYPVPHRDVYDSPPEFEPIIPNPWFDSSSNGGITGNWAHYPQISHPTASQVSPALLEYYPKLQWDSHYIYPPPLAFLLFPLSIFDYDTACHLWFFILSASLFGTGLLASRICATLVGHGSWLEGVSILVPTMPTLLFSENATALVLGNVSPLLGFLIAACAYGFLINRQMAIAFSTIPLLLFKGIGLAWCPMLLIGTRKWRTIWAMALLTAILNGLTLWFGGIEIYLTFFNEILPKASLPTGSGLAGLFLALTGINAEPVLRISTLILVVWILILYHRAITAGTAQGIASLPSVIAMIAVFNLMNPVVWPHYFTSYLILPFFPWIFLEIRKLQGKLRVGALVLFLSTALCWLDTALLSIDSWAVAFLTERDLYTDWMRQIRRAFSALAVCGVPLMLTSLILIMSICSLMRMIREARGVTARKTSPV